MREAWTDEDDLASKADGWALFNADGVVRIQRIDCPKDVSEEIGVKVTPRKSDDTALLHINAQAARGSRLHLLAMYIDGRAADDEFYVPTSLLNPAQRKRLSGKT